MNATVEKIVNVMFQNTEMSADAQALHDEIMNNCQERFDDLRAQGKTDDEAIACVIESLKGMEDVVAGYPKKPGASAAGEQNGDVLRMPAEGLSRVTADLKDIDLRCEPTASREFVVRYDHEACPNMEVRCEGGALVLENHLSVNGLNWLANLLLHGGAKRVVTLGVPAELSLTLDARSLSGNIHSTDVNWTSATTNSTSGDVRLSSAQRLERVEAKTASGNIRVTLSAASLSLRSMSGEVTVEGDCDTAELTSVSGNVRLHGQCESVELKSVSGNVQLDSIGLTLRQLNANSTSGNVRAVLDPATESVWLEATTVSGRVRNAFPDRGSASRVHVTARSVSGNVEVR